MRKPIRYILHAAGVSLMVTALAYAGPSSGNRAVNDLAGSAGDTVVADTVVADEDTMDAATAFIEIPRQDLDLLTKSMRQDMVLYMQADSVLKKLNVYMGESWIEKMTQDYMRVHLSDASDLQIKVLDTASKPGKVVMTIYTVTADSKTADSTVKFYDIGMKEIPASKYFTLPDPRSFYSFPKGEKVDKNAIYAIMPFYTVEYNISETGGRLTGRLTMSDYLTREDLARVDKYLDVCKEWEWNGKRFAAVRK